MFSALRAMRRVLIERSRRQPVKGTGGDGTGTSARSDKSGRPPKLKSSPDILMVSPVASKPVFRMLSTDR